MAQKNIYDNELFFACFGEGRIFCGRAGGTLANERTAGEVSGL